MAYNDRHSWNKASQDFDSDVAEDSFLVAFSQKVQIHKIGVLCTVTQTGTTAVDFEIANKTGLDQRAIGTVNVPASSPGKLAYKTISPPAVVAPGEWITYDSTNSGTGPSGSVLIEYSFFEEALGDGDEVATL